MNPTHLFLGTNADNIADRVAKGRPAGMAAPGANVLRGGNHPMAKLSDLQRAEMMEKRKAGASVIALAAEYGIGKRQASLVSRGVSNGRARPSFL